MTVCSLQDRTRRPCYPSAMPVPIVDSASPHALASGLRMTCFDIDGTIVDRRHQVSQRTADCFHFLKSKDVRIGIASGRPLFGVRSLLQDYDFDGPCSLFAGALLVNPQNDATLYECCFSPEQASAIMAVCARHNLYYELYTKDAFYIDVAEQAYTDIHEEYLSARPQRLKKMSDILSETLYKGLIIIPREAQATITQALSEALPNCSIGCSPGAAHPEIMFVNITSAQRSRRDTFAALIAHLGIEAEQVLAFGDGETDIEFLGSAGIGVAMGQAVDRVKKAAGYVTDSVDEDGVARAIHHIFGRP